MRILYITSGLKAFYPHRMIDQFITRALALLPHETKVFPISYRGNWKPDLYALIAKFKPTLIFTIHGLNMSSEIIGHLKRLGIKTAIWFVDDPYDVDESKGRLHGYDYIFTNEIDCIEVYRRRGYLNTHYLSLGTDERLFFPDVSPIEYRSDICMLGSPFPRRIQLLNYLIERLPQLHFKVVGPDWPRHGLSHKAEWVSRPVGPDEVRLFYNGARVNLNIHRNIDEQFASSRNLNTEKIPASAPNNRTFDIAACRAFQLMDHRPLLGRFYEVEKEIVTFQSEEELLAKVEYYLKNHAEMERIATNAYQRTMKEHRYVDRLSEMFRIVEEELRKERQQIVARFNQGKLIKDNRPPVYLVLDGRKHFIPTIAVFNQLGAKWENVKVLSQREVDQLPCGVTLEI